MERLAPRIWNRQVGVVAAYAIPVGLILLSAGYLAPIAALTSMWLFYRADVATDADDQERSLTRQTWIGRFGFAAGFLALVFAWQALSRGEEARILKRELTAICLDRDDDALCLALEEARLSATEGAATYLHGQASAWE